MDTENKAPRRYYAITHHMGIGNGGGWYDDQGNYLVTVYSFDTEAEREKWVYNEPDPVGPGARDYIEASHQAVREYKRDLLDPESGRYHGDYRENP